MNKAIQLGNLTRDPELQTYGGRSVVKFGIAVNERYKKGDEVVEKVHYFDYEAWGPKGEFIHKYFKKGDKILLESQPALDTWEDKATQEKRSKIVFRVVEAHFTGGKKEGGGEAKTTKYKGKPAKSDDDQGGNDDSSIPF
jgi:single-strand DNA-binding protein